MTDALKFSAVVATPEAAHSAATAAYQTAKQLTQAGKRARIQVAEDEDERSIRQNRYYWGCLLKETAEQARIEGQRYTSDAWHELGKRQFLPRKIKRIAVAGRKRRTTIVSIGSTTELSVKAMSRYIEQFTAFAVTDLGVRFSVQRWEDYRG